MERRYGPPSEEGGSTSGSISASSPSRMNRQSSPGRVTAEARDIEYPRPSASPRKMPSSPCEPIPDARPALTLQQGGWTSASRPSPTAAPVPLDEEARLAQYEVIRPVGAGRFGEVFIIRHKATNAVLCWKLVFYKGLREKEKKQLVSEVNVMRELRHPNIVRYHDRIVCRSKQCLYIVMEYCDAGDLAKQIEAAHKHHGGIDQDRIVLVVVQLIHALAYCHEGVGQEKRRVLHRDLKPCNIFLTSHPQYPDDASRCIAKLGDFGLSRHLNMHSMAHSCVGTPYYWSPELLEDGQKTYNVKSDLWALGCVIYEMCTGKTPFAQAQTIPQLKERVRKGPVLPIRGFSDSLNALMASLLQPNPNSRPSALQCLGYTIFRGCPYTPPPLYSASASSTRTRTVSPGSRAFGPGDAGSYSSSSAVASTRHSPHSSSANDTSARYASFPSPVPRLLSGAADSSKYRMQHTSTSTMRRVSASEAPDTAVQDPATSAHPQFHHAFPSPSSSPVNVHSQAKHHGAASREELTSQFRRASQNSFGFRLPSEREASLTRGNMSRVESQTGSQSDAGAEENSVVGGIVGPRTSSAIAAAAAAAVCAFEQHQADTHPDPSAPLTAIQEEEEEGTLSPSRDSQVCAATADTYSSGSQPDEAREKYGYSSATWAAEDRSGNGMTKGSTARNETQEHTRSGAMLAEHGGSMMSRNPGPHSPSARTSTPTGTYSVCSPAGVCTANKVDADDGAATRSVHVLELPFRGQETSGAQGRNREGELGHRAVTNPRSAYQASASRHGAFAPVSPAACSSVVEGGLCRRRSEPVPSNLLSPEERPTAWQAGRNAELFSFARGAVPEDKSQEISGSFERSASPSLSSASKTSFEPTRVGKSGVSGVPRETRGVTGTASARSMTPGRASSEYLTQEKQLQFYSPLPDQRQHDYGPGEAANERIFGRRGSSATSHTPSPNGISAYTPDAPFPSSERTWRSQRDVQYKSQLRQHSPSQTSGQSPGAPASPYEFAVDGRHTAFRLGPGDPKQTGAGVFGHQRSVGERPGDGGFGRASELHRQNSPSNKCRSSSITRRSSSASLASFYPSSEFPSSSFLSSAGGGVPGSAAISSVRSGSLQTDHPVLAARKILENGSSAGPPLLSGVASTPPSSSGDLFSQPRRRSASPAVGGVNFEEEPTSSVGLPTLLSPRFPPPDKLSRPDRVAFPFSAAPRQSLPGRFAEDGSTVGAAHPRTVTQSGQTTGGQGRSALSGASVQGWSTRREDGDANTRTSPRQIERSVHRMTRENHERFAPSGLTGDYACTARGRPKGSVGDLNPSTMSPSETFRQALPEPGLGTQQVQAESSFFSPVGSHDLTRPTTASSYCETQNGDWEAETGEEGSDQNQHASSVGRSSCSSARFFRVGGLEPRDTPASEEKITRESDIFRSRNSNKRGPRYMTPAGADSAHRSSISPRLLEGCSSHLSSPPTPRDTFSARPSPEGKLAELNFDNSARLRHASPVLYTADAAGRVPSVVCPSNPARPRPEHSAQSPAVSSSSDSRQNRLSGRQGFPPREFVPCSQEFIPEHSARGPTVSRLSVQPLTSGGFLSMDQQPKVTRRISAPTTSTVGKPSRVGNGWAAPTETAPFSRGEVDKLPRNYGPLNPRKSSFSHLPTEFSSPSLPGEEKAQKSCTAGRSSAEEAGAVSSFSLSPLDNPARSADYD
ncbi:nima-related protein kinase nima1, partial [Cystoisospora suis]